MRESRPPSGAPTTYRSFTRVRPSSSTVTRSGLGERFDPSVHEAVLREESDTVEHPMVAAELQRGYRLNERLS